MDQTSLLQTLLFLTSSFNFDSSLLFLKENITNDSQNKLKFSSLAVSFVDKSLRNFHLQALSFSLFPSQGKQRFRKCIWRLHHQQTFGQRKEIERKREKPLTDKQISCLSVMDSAEVIYYILVIWHQELPVKVKRIKRFLITSFLHSFNLFRARLIESPAAVCMKPFDSEAFINWVKIAMTWKGFKFQRDLLLQIEFSLERLLNQNKRIARRESLESRITIYIIKRSSTLLIESLMMKMDLVFPDVSWILILVCPYCARIAHLVLRVSS